MKNLLFLIYKRFVQFGMNYLVPGSRMNHAFTYVIYNPIVLFIIVIGFKISFSNYLNWIAILFLLLLIIIADLLKFGLFLNTFYLRWLDKFGQNLKEEAFSEIIFLKEGKNISELHEYINGHIKVLQGGVDNGYGNPTALVQHIRDNKAFINNLEAEGRKSNSVDWAVIGDFLFLRRPISFFSDHEIGIQSLVCLMIFAGYLGTQMINLEFVNNLHGVIVYIFLLSIIYSFFYFSIISNIRKDINLGVDSIIQLKCLGEDEKVNLYNTKKERFDKVFISSKFFKKYFNFFTIKYAWSILIGSTYFFFLSFIFAIYLYYFNLKGLDVFLSFFHFWIVFYLTIGFSLLWNYLNFSSLLMKSLFKKVISGIIGNLLIFALMSFLINGNFEWVIKKFLAYLGWSGVLWVFSIFQFQAFKRIFLESKSEIVWKGE